MNEYCIHVIYVHIHVYINNYLYIFIFVFIVCVTMYQILYSVPYLDSKLCITSPHVSYNSIRKIEKKIGNFSASEKETSPSCSWEAYHSRANYFKFEKSWKLFPWKM